jgi:hypothetical protein
MFELIYVYLHCKGATEYHAGFTETEAEAMQWAETERERFTGAPASCSPPEGFSCQAALCPMREAPPRCEYRPFTGTTAVQAPDAER